MPCWVVPSIAADLWGVPVAQVMARVEAGNLSSKTDAGFLFVDVMGGGNDQQSGSAETYTLVTRDEADALAAPTPAEVDEDYLDPHHDEQTETFAARDWQRVRAATGRTRRGPLAA